MLTSLYEKTKTWGPGSCMVAFYFFSLIPIVIFALVGSHSTEFDFRGVFISDISLFTHSLLVSPWVETLLIQVLLTKVFSLMKCRPANIIFAVSLIFAGFHFSNGILYPLIVYIPGLMFTWNYFLYYEKGEAGWGFLSTSVLHFLYNFTIFVMIPLINVVLTTYYGMDLLK